MIAITLWQPWASAIAAGLKTYETRSWPAEWRGPLAIAAAKRNTPELRRWWMQHVKSYDAAADLNAHYFEKIGIRDWCDLPMGAIVCTCVLAEVQTAEKLVESGRVKNASLEYSWGNFAPIDDESGRPRYGWRLEKIVPLKRPVPVIGKQGFFTVPDELLREAA